MFWHCWAITTWILGRAASSSSAHLLGKQDQTSELGLGVCRELLCPRGSMLGAQCRCPGMVLAAPQSRRGASPEECLSLGFWDASSKDSEPESCTWEQQECCFQETGGLPGTDPSTLAGGRSEDVWSPGLEPPLGWLLLNPSVVPRPAEEMLLLFCSLF